MWKPRETACKEEKGGAEKRGKKRVLGILKGEIQEKEHTVFEGSFEGRQVEELGEEKQWGTGREGGAGKGEDEPRVLGQGSPPLLQLCYHSS